MIDEPNGDLNDTPAASPSGVGERLRAAREAHHLTLEQASEMLRIEPKFLAALEQERFEAIGAAVFVKGYLRHYAELLGLDPQPLLAAHSDKIARTEPALQGRRSIGHEKEKPVVAIALGVVGGLLLIGVLWKVVLAPAPSREVPDTSPAVVQAPAERPAEPSAVMPQSVDSAQRADGVAMTEPAAVERGVTGQAQLNAQAPATAGARVTEQTPVTAEGRVTMQPPVTVAPATEAAPDEGQSAAGNARAVTAAANLDIELRFAEDSWTEVIGAGGERLFYGLGRAGAAERFDADDDVSVLLGNADGVTVFVNGTPYAPPTGSRRGEMARFTISANASQ